ncbi:phage tail protein [Streptococcus parasanguinis]|uniref:phage tail tube protein n=1 Tax=Streptococcus parasanguinis TaxID=1318 RepID=UPI0012BD2CD1|nr:phage tail protein [Streptococcus parasanguinis]MTR54210.1 phage tail protein [Streptococcus parasanguinis]MTR56150.1 phage tail protein [Streptococcus parasanguinis]MTR60782.1 phage tail protein [Streptococcus parasanguinis]MTR69967.1 phage tail protein [Streptococcus parasanguinis]MTS02511.1 phage tail protein [Streptococcus parasanguinis]
MARYKNALRGHFIAPVTDPKVEPEKSTYLELAKWIEDIADDTDEATNSVAYYDGDGTEETTVTSVKGSYTFKGTYDKEDPAMKHIAGLKYKLGNERLVWHKIVDADGKNQAVGIATVSDIKAGSGAAAEYEEFSCKISYNSLPKISAVV